MEAVSFGALEHMDHMCRDRPICGVQVPDLHALLVRSPANKVSLETRRDVAR